MIHFFYGENTTKAREKYHEFLDSFFDENPDALLFEMDADTWDSGKFDELFSSRGLFGGVSLVVLNSVFQNDEAKEYILGELKEMKESPSAFVIIEGKLTKSISEKVAKKSETVHEFSGEKVSKKEEFNRFAITDAIGRRSKKDSWVLLQKAFMEEIPPEEIHGILFWRVKSMILSASAKTALEAGLNPFVFKKAISFSKNYTEDELKNLSSKLVAIYHEARRGGLPAVSRDSVAQAGDELPIALEKFVLNI